jgi:hypothetical protein
MSPYTKAGLQTGSVFAAGTLIGMPGDRLFPEAGGRLQVICMVAAGVIALIYWRFRPPRRPEA